MNAILDGEGGGGGGGATPSNKKDSGVDALAGIVKLCGLAEKDSSDPDQAAFAGQIGTLFQSFMKPKE